MNSNQIKTLKTFSNAKDTFAVLDKLYAAFLKTHKRKETVDLTFTSLSSPLLKKGKRFPQATSDTYEIRCHFNDTNKAEYEWFANEVNNIK